MVANLCNGQPPRSGIESQIKVQLRQRSDHAQDTAIAWVRSHVGIPGNEEAGKLANWSSQLAPSRPQCLHLDKNRKRPATRLAPPHRKDQQPKLPLQRHHPTNRTTHCLPLPHPKNGKNQVVRRKEQLGRNRLPQWDQGGRQQIRGRSYAFL